MTPRVKVFVDSGAYSAIRSGKPVNLAEYCAYLHENEEWIHTYAALDVLTPGAPEDGAKLSWENYRYMRKQGLHPMPVYHYGEDISWLYRMLDDGCDYIALGGTAILGNKVAASAWYSNAWSHLVNAKGEPVVKVHGFGEGNMSIVRRFPWHSVDSSTWIVAALRTPNLVLDQKRKVNVGVKDNKADNIDAMPPEDFRIYEAFLAEHGFTHADLVGENNVAYTIRGLLAAKLYHAWEQEVRDQRKKQPARYDVPGLFRPPPHKGTGARIDPFNFHLVIGGNPCNWTAIAEAEHEAILCSYFYITQNTNCMFTHLREFVMDPHGSIQRNPRWKKYHDLLPQ